MLCAVKNSPGVRQPINICIAPRDRPVLRSKRLNHSIEIALALVIALTPFVKTLNGRKGLRRSIISARFTRFSRSSTSDGRTGTVPGSKICRTISARAAQHIRVCLRSMFLDLLRESWRCRS